MTESRYIETFLKTIDACFDEGVFFAEGGYLEADFSKISDVGHRMDPEFLPQIVA